MGTRAATILALGALLLGPTARADERVRALDARARTRCTIDSGLRGGAAKADLSCLYTRLGGLEKAIATGDPTKMSIATNLLRTCEPRIRVERVRRIAQGEAPELDERYLATFEEALVPYGAKIARCYSELGLGGVPPTVIRAGKMKAEIAVGKDGRATEVALSDNAGVDGFVVGCVVRALCGLAAPPPKAAFVLELPFAFADSEGKLSPP